VLESAWKQETIVGLRRQNVLAMGNVAKKRRVGFWIYVYAMNNSKIVTVSVRVSVPIDFQDVPGNVDLMPLEEPVNIIPINWCTPIPPEIV
jgi:hypothetical protein